MEQVTGVCRFPSGTLGRAALRLPGLRVLLIYHRKQTAPLFRVLFVWSR